MGDDRGGPGAEGRADRGAEGRYWTLFDTIQNLFSTMLHYFTLCQMEMAKEPKVPGSLSLDYSPDARVPGPGGPSKA